MHTPWTVEVAAKTQKAIPKLPKGVQARLSALLADMSEHGPVRGNWSNYSKLYGNRHHCHIKKGKPCYVAVWEVIDCKIRLIEVQYAGTHENAPY